MLAAVVVGAVCIALGLPGFLLTFFNPRDRSQGEMFKDEPLRKSLNLLSALTLAVGLYLFGLFLAGG